LIARWNGTEDLSENGTYWYGIGLEIDSPEEGQGILDVATD